MPRLSGLIILAAAVVLVTGMQPPRGTSASPGGKMYWTYTTRAKIQRANLDGSGMEDFLPTDPVPLGIALDLTAPEPVGGIAELPEMSGAPREGSGASGGDVGLLGGIVAAGFALGGAAWYAGRRWTRRRRDGQRVRERANRCRFERYPSIRSVPVDKEGPA